MAWCETWRLTMPRRAFDLHRPVDAEAEEVTIEDVADSAADVGTDVDTRVDFAELEASAEEAAAEET